jgi:general secretion pathway protein N
MSAATHPLLRSVLTVFAIWAGGVLLVVEFGLGARYSLHPDGVPEAGQVPEVALLSGLATAEGFEHYSSIVERPLFSADRRPIAADAAGQAAADEAPAPAPLTVVVTSIILTDDKRIAIVVDPSSNKSQTVSMGGALSGDQAAWRLVELEPRRAVFEGPGGRSALDLRVFDGQGGEPPTPVAVPSQANRDAAANTAGAGSNRGNAAGNASKGDSPAVPGGGPQADSPEARAEAIRKRIEERRRQMREEAERANAERGQ